jgi:hypothetical protein
MACRVIFVPFGMRAVGPELAAAADHSFVGGTAGLSFPAAPHRIVAGGHHAI